MKKMNLLSALLLLGAFALSVPQGAFADETTTATAATTCSPSAQQIITGTLNTCHCVETNGGNLKADISCPDGALSTAFTPSFKITTNSKNNQNMYLKAECNTLTGMKNALGGSGSTGSTYIALSTAGETGLPAATAVINALSATPTANLNGNVIAYPIDKPANVGTNLVYTWDPTVGSERWNAVLAKKGQTITSVNIPAGAARPDTFSFDDDPGSYQATITLSFV